jgi:hypothetical protein
VLSRRRPHRHFGDAASDDDDDDPSRAPSDRRPIGRTKSDECDDRALDFSCENGSATANDPFDDASGNETRGIVDGGCDCGFVCVDAVDLVRGSVSGNEPAARTSASAGHQNVASESAASESGMTNAKTSGTRRRSARESAIGSASAT